MLLTTEMKIQTAKAFIPPSSNSKKVAADEFLANGGEIRGKYVWMGDGKLLGVAFDAVIEEDSSYCVIFATMDDVKNRLCINSNFVQISN